MSVIKAKMSLGGLFVRMRDICFKKLPKKCIEIVFFLLINSLKFLLETQKETKIRKNIVKTIKTKISKSFTKRKNNC